MGVVIPIDKNKSERSFALNHTAVSVWEMLKDNVELSDLICEMIKKFDVPEQELKKDLNEFLNQMQKIGLLEV